MSGGVDSSVAALLLKRQGYQVEGLFMKNWEEDDGTEYCTAAADLADAEAVAERLEIPLHRANFAAEYWQDVFDHFLREYRAGRTPNPDVLCNREIKFKAFLEYARLLGADRIATGHYARTRRDGAGCRLLKGLDPDKDQTYFLHSVSGAQLALALFPVGALRKSEVRRLAAEHRLATHDKKDSTGICFIGERRFSDFLETWLPPRPGAIVDETGRVLGEHQGLMFHTIGQRRGLGIGGRRNAADAPWYVLDKDLAANRLIVGQGVNHPRLLAARLECEAPCWIDGQGPELPFRGAARIRHGQADQDCTLSRGEDGFLVDFDAPQRAVTPGQYVVFYAAETCLGGALIRRAGGDKLKGRQAPTIRGKSHHHGT